MRAAVRLPASVRRQPTTGVLLGQLPAAPSASRRFRELGTDTSRAVRRARPATGQRVRFLARSPASARCHWNFGYARCNGARGGVLAVTAWPVDGMRSGRASNFSRVELHSGPAQTSSETPATSETVSVTQPRANAPAKRARITSLGFFDLAFFDALWQQNSNASSAPARRSPRCPQPPRPPRKTPRAPSPRPPIEQTRRRRRRRRRRRGSRSGDGANRWAGGGRRPRRAAGCRPRRSTRSCRRLARSCRCSSRRASPRRSTSPRPRVWRPTGPATRGSAAGVRTRRNRERSRAFSRNRRGPFVAVGPG